VRYLILTKSKAAIFRLVSLISFLWCPSGSYIPTRSVLGVSSFGARSCQIIFSGGFWEVGVKNEATAVSENK
jgi:hypothetical protein